MSLVEETLFGREDKVEIAIQRLKSFQPKNEPYWLAFSGGKDSQCIYHLAKMAGVSFEAHYSVTSVDPPELMRFIRDEYPDVIWDRHYWDDGKPQHYFPDGSPRPITMWGLIADHTIPPTRQARYCCSALKETGGHGRKVVTGVRWAESARRKALHGVADIQTESKKLHAEARENSSYKQNKNGGIVFMDDNEDSRRMVEQCYAKRKTTINPIVDWTDEDVWEFLNDVAKVPHCCLYDEGFTRLGCIGCPLAGRDCMLRDFERWPRYKDLYIRAFDKMIKNHPGEIKVATGEMVEDSNAGGAPQYTQDGSHGMPDEFGNGLDHATEKSGTDRQTDRQRNDGSIRLVDGTANIRPLDLEFQKRPKRTTTAQTRPETIYRDKTMVNNYGISAKPAITGKDYLMYWLWLCRTNQLDWSVHPLRKFNPKEIDTITLIRE